MARPIIFVSYSARKNPAGQTPDKDRAEALVEDLRQDGFEPWWDQDGLELNDDWNDRISEALSTCHGAVVLLSPVAIKSDFVRHEAGYLSIRRRTEIDFPLCSFLCDGLQIEDVGPFFKAIQFSRFQFKQWEMDSRRTALKKALHIAHERARIPATSIDLLENALAGPKYFGSIDAGHLRGVARNLGWDAESHWKLDRAVPRLFVRHLFSISIDDQLDALIELGGQMTDAQVNEVFGWVAPFWIDERAACHFGQLVDAEPGRRGAVINGRIATFTPNMFARRCQPHLRWNPSRFRIDSHTATGRLGGVLEQARRSILRRLGLEDNASAAAIRETLVRFSRHRKLCSVICDADEKDLEDMVHLQQEFREVIFVALTGDRSIAIPPNLAGNCQIVDPPLRSEASDSRHHEGNAYAAYNLCMEDLQPNTGEQSDEQ